MFLFRLMYECKVEGSFVQVVSSARDFGHLRERSGDHSVQTECSVVFESEIYSLKPAVVECDQDTCRSTFEDYNRERNYDDF